MATADQLSRTQCGACTDEEGDTCCSYEGVCCVAARNIGIREGTKMLLQAITAVKNVNVFDKFAESLVSSIQSIFPASTSVIEVVREKLLSAFHTK